MQTNHKFTNNLINETSPYLLQHAHNPVEWYPWGEEAFEKAAAEDKPVLVSIGYSACHWCHVMEHESFEDEAAAALMNENFVNIKVDMEERPDVDQIYMAFVQMTTGRGGWPMNVFITPDKRPFFGGTYFPPSPRYGMPSWSQILISISEAWRERRSELLNSADQILVELKKIGNAELAASGVAKELCDTAFQSLARSFDARNGGFGGAPKFPAAMSMEFLLRYWRRTQDQNALDMVVKTAEKMANGGIYDQLGGGFHRYAVDAIWLVPHFEKMLYDNAQLARVYLHLYQIMKSRERIGGTVEADPESLKSTAVEILEYVRREMLDGSGGFYSTQDADSEGEEGKFFVWTPEEVDALLGEEDSRIFCFYYDISDEGNFEGKNILNVKMTDTEVCEALKISQDRLDAVLSHGRKTLFDDRERRIKPFRDEKVLTAWNGLMLAAFAEAGAVLGSEEYIDIARKNAEFILEGLLTNENEKNNSDASAELAGRSLRAKLLRTWKDGRAKLNGYIEDHANLADGLIELYRASGETKYLHKARELADVMITEFWDEENGGFFFTSNDHEELIVRNKEFVDNATPSGNSVAADVLYRLSRYFDDERYERFASTTLRMAASQIKRHPQAFGRALATIESYIAPKREVIVAGDRDSALWREVVGRYDPEIIAGRTDGKESGVPLLSGRDLLDGKAAAYVCENFVCELPVTDVAEMANSLDR